MAQTVGWWLLAQASAGNTSPSRFEQIINWLNANPVIGWGMAGFAVFALAVGAVAKLTGNLDKIFGFFGKYGPKRKAITEEQRQKLRRQLIAAELGQVVKRLEDSLHHKIRLDLKRKEELQRVGRRDAPASSIESSPDPTIRKEFNPFESPEPPTPVAAEMSTVALLEREDIQGRLLILGEPGAGKTNELLTVAKALLQQAQGSDDKPIPVIFELSGWSSQSGETFAD